VRVLAWLLLLVPLGVWGQVYRSVDPDGRTVFSDRPMPNAEQLDLPLGAVGDPDTGGAVADSASNPDGGFPGPYEMLEIVAPDNDSRSRDPNGEVPVSLVIAPSLMDGHRLVVEVDGVAAAGDLPNPTQILLQGLRLGTHRIRAVVQDTDAATVAATPMITVHLLRPLPDAATP
jgi:hypothetical protein